jgi:hypothetical protein
MGKLTHGQDTNPVILIFKMGFIRENICKIVRLKVEDGVNGIEAR